MAVNEKLLQTLKSNPKALAQILGRLGVDTSQNMSFKSGVNAKDPAERVGMNLVTPAIAGKIAAARIKEGSPSEIEDRIKFNQDQDRAEKLKSLAQPFIEGGESRISGVTMSPTGDTLKFEPSLEKQAEQKERELKTVSDIKQREETIAGRKLAVRSMTAMSGAMRDFSSVLVDAFKEESIGDLKSAVKTAIAQKVGGEDEPLAASKLAGKKTEIITKMMPILTQQGDKKGSVRLVSTIFEKLLDTAPGQNRREDIRGNQIAPRQALGMLEETVRSMFRFTQAATSMGLNDLAEVIQEDKKGKKDPLKEGSLFNEILANIEVDEAEVDAFIADVLEPLNTFITERDIEGQNKKFELNDDEKLELDDINRQLAEMGE